MKLGYRLLAPIAALVLALASPLMAAAQVTDLATPPPPGSTLRLPFLYDYSGGLVRAQGSVFLGLDSVTGKDCLIGLSSTCGMPILGSISSGGGQAQTAFSPTGQTPLSAGTTSTAIALPSAGPTALVINSGLVPAFIKFGASGVTATTSNGFLVPAGWGIAFNFGTNTQVAAITQTGSASLTIETGTGIPTLTGGGGGGTSTGSGGAVTSIDGGIVSLGSINDPHATLTGSWSVVSELKFLNDQIGTLLGDQGNTATVQGAVSVLPQTLGGATPKSVSLKATPTLFAPAGAHTLYSLSIDNTANVSGAATTCNFYDVASTASVTVGTTTPAFWFTVPGTGVSNPQLAGDMGVAFANGIVVACVTAVGGSTAPANNASVTGVFK